MTARSTLLSSTASTCICCFDDAIRKSREEIGERDGRDRRIIYRAGRREERREKRDLEGDMVVNEKEEGLT